MYGEGTIINELLAKIFKKEKVRVSNDTYSTHISIDDVSNFFFLNLSSNFLKEMKKLKILHLSSNKSSTLYNFIKSIAKKEGLDKYVVAENEIKFSKKYKKPKYLGLKSNVDFDTTPLEELFTKSI